MILKTIPWRVLVGSYELAASVGGDLNVALFHIEISL